jgi:hypothetical protein
MLPTGACMGLTPQGNDPRLQNMGSNEAYEKVLNLGGFWPPIPGK